MKKKIEWWLVEADGKNLFVQTSRLEARNNKKWYDENIFNECYDDIKYPVKIVRREYHLVDEKVVR